MIETKWWWVRHAPVPDGGRIYGQKDLPCDCSDGHVFAAVAGVLPRDAVWVTSHLQRTTQTAAAIIAASHGAHAPTEIAGLPEFAEQHLGDWQDMDRVTFRRDRGMTTASFWFSAADVRAPNGESFVDLVDRVSPTIHRLTETYKGRNIVAVTHGGTIRAAIGVALGLSADAVHAFTIDNCSVTCLDHIADPARKTLDKWRVGAVNHRPWGGLPKASVHA